LRTLAKAQARYGRRVCKYASQVLYMMWQWREMHDTFRRAGLSEADFYSTGTLQHPKHAGKGGGKFSDAHATLARPISSQGDNKRAQSGQDSANAYGSIGDSPQPAGLNNGQQSQNSPAASLPDGGKHNGSTQNGVGGEPLYAAVQKQQHNNNNGHQQKKRERLGQAEGGDSWV